MTPSTKRFLIALLNLCLDHKKALCGYEIEDWMRLSDIDINTKRWAILYSNKDDRVIIDTSDKIRRLAYDLEQQGHYPFVWHQEF